jgi:hypothetical protein
MTVESEQLVDRQDLTHVGSQCHRA